MMILLSDIKCILMILMYKNYKRPDKKVKVVVQVFLKTVVVFDDGFYH